MLADRQRGDTIIEVLLAVGVFSLVAVGALSIMNQSSASAQRSLEVTLVRQQVDGQVEALRAAHQAYESMTSESDRDASVWKDMVAYANSGVASVGNIDLNCPSTTSLANQLVMNNYYGTISVNPAFSMSEPDAPVYASIRKTSALVGGGIPGVDAEEVVTVNSYGIWIEADKVADPVGGVYANVADAYDFRVRACWDDPRGGSVPPVQLETNVRLYDPR